MVENGKVALVTGAGRGIGRAIALRLADEVDILAVCSLGLDNAVRVADEINEAGLRANPYQADVSQAGQVQRVVAAVLNDFGRIDILVNNAGSFSRASISTMSEEQWDQVIDVNLKGTFLCCRAVIPHMLSRGSGCIINIASTSGITGGTSGAHYAAAKGGVIAFTRSLGRELAGQGIRVNAVAPSNIETDMLQASRQGYLQDIVDKVPLGRTGKPEEIADIVAFLASDAASYIVGEVIVASGGYY
jgi:3-oxoacyl-[acyl-carrier protein] reductase